MEQEDWNEVLQLILRHLKSLDRSDLDRVKMYKKMYEQITGPSKHIYDSLEKYLTLKMLVAIYSNLYAESPNLLKSSITNIGKAIKSGECPRELHVQMDDDKRVAKSYKKMEGKTEVSNALSYLRKVIRKFRKQNYNSESELTTTKKDYLSELDQFFDKYGVLVRDNLLSFNMGKIYELYCLKNLLEWIENRYDVSIVYRDPIGDGAIYLRSSAGMIRRNRYSYFVVSDRENSEKNLEVHMNIEILTKSARHLKGNQAGARAYSSEIDIVLIESEQNDNYRPNYTKLVLGVECKFHKKFKKKVINEVIGIRSEISTKVFNRIMFRLDEIFTLNPKRINRYDYFDPSSEYWLAQIQDVSKDIKMRLKDNGVKLYLLRHKV